MTPFVIEITTTSDFAKYSHEGRYGYVCKLTKNANDISARKCALWFAANHRRFRTRRFIMVAPDRFQAVILRRHFINDSAFANIPVRIVSRTEASEACSEKAVSKYRSLAVVNA